MEKKKRIGNLIKRASIIAGVLGAYALFVHFTGLAIPCIVHLITGFNCPGCGISRFGMSILNFHFAEALHYNYMAPLIIVYVAYVAISTAISYVKTGRWNVVPKPDWLNWAFLGILIIWAIIRNIFRI